MPAHSEAGLVRGFFREEPVIFRFGFNQRRRDAALHDSAIGTLRHHEVMQLCLLTKRGRGVANCWWKLLGQQVAPAQVLNLSGCAREYSVPFRWIRATVPVR